MKKRTLHAGISVGWGHYFWFEHGVDFEFTGRIKYIFREGEFEELYLEIERRGEERHWYTFWKKTPVTYLDWIASDLFEDKYPHENIIDEFVEECN